MTDLTPAAEALLTKGLRYNSGRPLQREELAAIQAEARATAEADGAIKAIVRMRELGILTDQKGDPATIAAILLAKEAQEHGY